MIAAETGSDLFHILPVTSYPSDYTECTTVAKRELNANARIYVHRKARLARQDHHPVLHSRRQRVVRHRKQIEVSLQRLHGTGRIGGAWDYGAEQTGAGKTKRKELAA